MCDQNKQVKSTIEKIKEDINRLSPHPDQVEIVAVTKRKPVSAIRSALDAGITSIGENYAQELRNKSLEINDPRIQWHFIGHLQKNKINMIKPFVHTWQTIDSVETASALLERVPRPRVYVEVNMTDDPNRAGVSKSEAESTIKEIVTLGLDVQGVMCVAGLQDNAKDDFRFARGLADRCGLKKLSAGMSLDYKTALQCGTNVLRLGSLLFGARDKT